MSKYLMEENNCRSIEGTRLSLTTPYDTPLEITFIKYINVSLESKIFVSTMAPPLWIDVLAQPGFETGFLVWLHLLL